MREDRHSCDTRVRLAVVVGLSVEPRFPPPSSARFGCRLPPGAGARSAPPIGDEASFDGLGSSTALGDSPGRGFDNARDVRVVRPGEAFQGAEGLLREADRAAAHE